MQSFRYVRAGSFQEAAALLARDGMALAGGTDLIPLLQEGLATPGMVVDLRRIPAASRIVVSQAAGARIGALSRLADLAGHAALRRRYPALVEACRQVGTPQIRHMGTLGGNLCQRPRCWYFRSAVPCWKTGAPVCPARDGMSEYLAVLGGGPCWAAHPSDLAVALLALDARVTVRQPDGASIDVPLDELFVLPAERMERETRLKAGEVIERVTLPARLGGVSQTFLKATQRQAWDFALVSVAAVWPRRRRQPRVALGGVAPRPWLVAAHDLPPRPLSRASRQAVEAWAAEVAECALRGATPLPHNGYKLDIARGLIRRVLSGWAR